MARVLRRNQVDLRATTVYHVVSRCTRALHLLKDQDQDGLELEQQEILRDDGRLPRKDWIFLWLRELATHFALEIVGFAIMDNHVHVLVNLRPRLAEKWSAREVARRWLAVHRPRNGYMQPIEPTAEHIAAFVADPRKVESARERLASLSQFMKDFKQHVAERANREDGVTGSFWEGRYKCKAVFDEAQLVATMCYIDLNPFAAGACRRPTDGRHTSVKVRMNRSESRSVVGSEGAEREAAEREDASGLGESRRNIQRNSRRHFPNFRGRNFRGRGRGWMAPMKRAGRGVLSGMTLRRYVKLLEQTARLLRPGKRRLRPGDTRPVRLRASLTPQHLAELVRQLFDDWHRRAPGLVELRAGVAQPS